MTRRVAAWVMGSFFACLKCGFVGVAPSSAFPGAPVFTREAYADFARELRA